MYLRQFFESQGLARGTARLINLIGEGKLKSDEFSLRAMWEAMGRPPLQKAYDQMAYHIPADKDGEISESALKEFFEAPAMDATYFPKLTGALVNRTVMDAYRLSTGVGLQLVTRIPSTQRDEIIVGFTAAQEPVEIPEGQEYESRAFYERYHKIENRKYGSLIGLTEEMVKFDQTGQLLMAARNAGRSIAARQEKLIVHAIIEATSTESWRPQGTKTALYDNSSNNPFLSGTFDNVITDVLADETDVTAAVTELAAAKTEEGEPAVITPTHLFAADALAAKARKIILSPGTTESNQNEGVINPYRNQVGVLTSPHIDQQLGSTYWLYGDFPSQFIYTEVFPVETLTARADADIKFMRDLVWVWKGRFMGGCGAVDNQHVIRSTGGG